MNPTLSAFVMTIVTDWYSRVARWTPPGDSSAHGCPHCQISPFLRLPGLAEWPHDVTHPLVTSLDAAVTEVQRSFDEFDAAAVGSSDTDSTSHALSLVSATVLSNMGDIVDVLEKCVAPALEQFVSREVNDAMHAFEQAASAHE